MSEHDLEECFNRAEQHWRSLRTAKDKARATIAATPGGSIVLLDLVEQEMAHLERLLKTRYRATIEPDQAPQPGIDLIEPGDQVSFSLMAGNYLMYAAARRWAAKMVEWAWAAGMPFESAVVAAIFSALDQFPVLIRAATTTVDDPDIQERATIHLAAWAYGAVSLGNNPRLRRVLSNEGASSPALLRENLPAAAAITWGAGWGPYVRSGELRPEHTLRKLLTQIAKEVEGFQRNNWTVPPPEETPRDPDGLSRRLDEASAMAAGQIDADAIDDAARDHMEAAIRRANLSPRERSILDHIRLGRPYKEIAAELNISVKTIDEPRAKALKKIRAGLGHKT